jgi:hypothetical protein
MISYEGGIDKLSLMFEAARSYIGGAKIIIASEGIRDDNSVNHPTLPVITCSAFAIEIQLKLLIEANKETTQKTHDLEELFDALSSSLQDEILMFQSSYTYLSADQVRDFLSKEKDAFEHWRYPYEKKSLETQPSALFQFALALSDFIKSKYQIERSENGWLRTGTD